MEETERRSGKAVQMSWRREGKAMEKI